MKKILIVDDSEVNLFLIRTIFENDPDICVDIESESLKALSRLREGLYDVLVLDLMMPHIDGFKLLEFIRSDDKLKDIPILVVSARQDSETIARVKVHGIEGYIKKPINMNDIENRIRNIFDKKVSGENGEDNKLLQA